MSEQEGRVPEEPAVRDEHDTPDDDGFPAEDVAPDEPDPGLDVADPFAVGDDREPLEEPDPDEELED